MSRILGNPVLEAIRERALVFVQEEDDLREQLDYWTSISHLSESPGWERLIEIVENSVTSNTDKLVTEIDPRNIAFLQAQVQALRWLLKIPRMAADQIEAAHIRKTDLDTRKNNYVREG